jgi:hypothetical protein
MHQMLMTQLAIMPALLLVEDAPKGCAWSM